MWQNHVKTHWIFFWRLPVSLLTSLTLYDRFWFRCHYTAMKKNMSKVAPPWGNFGHILVLFWTLWRSTAAGIQNKLLNRCYTFGKGSFIVKNTGNIKENLEKSSEVVPALDSNDKNDQVSAIFGIFRKNLEKTSTKCIEVYISRTTIFSVFYYFFHKEY